MRRLKVSSDVNMDSVELHKPPKKKPPRRDLRKPRLLKDEDLKKPNPRVEDKDLNV